MTRVLSGWRCPVDPGHGSVIPLAYPGRWGWYCPHETHDGWRDQPRTRAFFTTSEVETGHLDSTGTPVNAGDGTPAALEPPASRPFRPGGGSPLPPPGPDSAPTGAPRAASGRRTPGSPAASDLGLFPAVREGAG